jgi:hypothetical protein
MLDASQLFDQLGGRELDSTGSRSFKDGAFFSLSFIAPQGGMQCSTRAHSYNIFDFLLCYDAFKIHALAVVL